MILAPLKQLPKEELVQFQVAWDDACHNQLLDVGESDRAGVLAAINAHRAKLDKVVSELVELTTIAKHLMYVFGPKCCPNWIEGVGDCNAIECDACRSFRCDEQIDDLIRRLKEEL